MSSSEMVDLKPEKIDGVLERAKAALSPEDYAIIKGLFATIIMLQNAYKEKTASVTRLLKIIFGAKTEKKKKKNPPDDKNTPVDDINNKDTAADENSDAPFEDADSKEAEQDPSVSDEITVPETFPVNDQPSEPEKKPKGHGRNGVDDYPGAEREFISNDKLKPGDPCIYCNGKVYKLGTPGVIIRLFGQAPIKAVITEFEKYRCNLCGYIYYPDAVSEIPEERYDETAVSMMAISRYGFGIPFYRLGRMEECFGTPLSPSTQFDKVEAGADKIYPVFDELQVVAAQGKVLYTDDTPMTVIELVKQNEEGDQMRKGMFTSCVMSITDEKQIAIFKTGRQHAGENISDIYEKREPGIAAPIQMSDAASRNYSPEFEAILSSCNAHGRRKFVEIEPIFPDQCSQAIDFFGQIYKNDEITKEKGMSDEERLEFHQEQSGPVMNQFHTWLIDQLEQKSAEPNSSLGKAISYTLKHWEKLTLFLREPGAPLDNNICERALKMAIMHRKNSLFYKTVHGAYIGDIYMSLIHTCILNKVNPFDYLVELQRHKKQLFKNPENWMPWNYRDTISVMNSAVQDVA